MLRKNKTKIKIKKIKKHIMKTTTSIITLVMIQILIYSFIQFSLWTLVIFAGCMIFMLIITDRAKEIKNNNDKIYDK